MNDLIDTTEMYLKTIFELEEEGTVPLRARIAERLHQSGPTVSQTVARMQRDGLVNVEGDRHLELTDEGRAYATSVMRKHRLAELLLTRVLGLEWEKVHAEACRWEHVMSDDVEAKIVALLDDPHIDPYGNPVPGLAALGATEMAVNDGPLITLSAAAAGSPKVTIRRISEHLQPDIDLLRKLDAGGVRPGKTLPVAVNGSGVRLGEIDLEAAVADHIFVIVTA